jgi:hypothetical protein
MDLLERSRRPDACVEPGHLAYLAADIELRIASAERDDVAGVAHRHGALLVLLSDQQVRRVAEVDADVAERVRGQRRMAHQAGAVDLLVFVGPRFPRLAADVALARGEHEQRRLAVEVRKCVALRQNLLHGQLLRQ